MFMEKKIGRIFLNALSFFLFLLSFCFPEGTVFAQEEKLTTLIEAARKEGQMTLYTSMNLNKCTDLVQNFHKKYPFIKTDLLRLQAENILVKLLAEAKAKHISADVIINGGFRTHITKKEGLLMKYISPEAKAYRDGFKDPEGYWTDTFVTANVLIYNTKLISPREFPTKSHEDLLQPKWKGKIGMESFPVDWFIQMLKFMGEKKGLDYMNKLALQKPNIRTGGNLLTSLVAAGEFPMAINVTSSMSEEAKAIGASVDLIPLDPVIGVLHPIAISANAPHPNAAKLFVNFVLSKEGMELIKGYRDIPSRTDVEPDTPLLRGIKIYPSDPKSAEESARYIELYRSIFLKK